MIARTRSHAALRGFVVAVLLAGAVEAGGGALLARIVGRVVVEPLSAASAALRGANPN